ncbi:hypothetical protein HDU97_009141 [Phlyctochytrium planicorne]|nr:hypothetical protein HDU97_009141 [Phlyctochytrium planicorne]
MAGQLEEVWVRHGEGQPVLISTGGCKYVTHLIKSIKREFQLADPPQNLFLHLPTQPNSSPLQKMPLRPGLPLEMIFPNGGVNSDEHPLVLRSMGDARDANVSGAAGSRISHAQASSSIPSPITPVSTPIPTPKVSKPLPTTPTPSVSSNGTLHLQRNALVTATALSKLISTKPKPQAAASHMQERQEPKAPVPVSISRGLDASQIIASGRRNQPPRPGFYNLNGNRSSLKRKDFPVDDEMEAERPKTTDSKRKKSKSSVTPETASQPSAPSSFTESSTPSQPLPFR